MWGVRFRDIGVKHRNHKLQALDLQAPTTHQGFSLWGFAGVQILLHAVACNLCGQENAMTAPLGLSCFVSSFYGPETPRFAQTAYGQEYLKELRENAPTIVNTLPYVPWAQEVGG